MPEMLSFLDLPAELRERVYILLIERRQTPRLVPQEESWPRGRLSQSDRLESLDEADWCVADSISNPDSGFLTSTTYFGHAFTFMRACKLIQAEVSYFVHRRMIWHAKVGDFYVPSLPVQICAAPYARLIRNFRLFVKHDAGFGLFTLMTTALAPGEDDKLLKTGISRSSIYKNTRSFCELLRDFSVYDCEGSATAGKAVTSSDFGVDTDEDTKGLTLQVDVQMVQEMDLVGFMQALSPLKEVLTELKVGALCFRSGPANNPDCDLVVSNKAYQRLRTVLGHTMRWNFPNPKAQYKD